MIFAPIKNGRHGNRHTQLGPDHQKPSPMQIHNLSQAPRKQLALNSPQRHRATTNQESINKQWANNNRT
ncbi:hypothetical protein DPMN_160682 [Dreissena polymorpha]|uniref:Uncharacterized protein n=1 Tax=Dreissena polymorpha TaxID=45954 RepID=A0A9D4ISS4_DREPO|nr:hypothetical protein DPMN_160682 [Dreissena polymorpha]